MDRREYLKNLGLGLGYTMSFGTLMYIAQSCKSDETNGKTFSKTQFDLLNEYTETIIPKTKTLGAKDTKCAQFIQKMVTEIYSEEDRKAFIQGIDELENDFTKTNNKSFLEASPKERESYLTHIDATLAKFPPSMWGIVLIKQKEPISFFRNLKQATLLAYFTSKELAEFNTMKVSHG